MDLTAPASGAISPVGCPDRVRVIAVEEDPIYRTGLAQMLQRCGYEVTAKASPEEALREVQHNPEAFDLVFTVAHTKGTGIDGFGLLKHLRNRLPVILFSGDEPVQTVMRAIEGGACDFVIKPLRDKDMHNIWRHVIQWRRRNAANGGADRRKRGSTAVVRDSGEDGTTKKTKINWSLQHASVVKAAHELRATTDYSPRGIQDHLEAQGVEVTVEEVTSHLVKYRRDCPINQLPAMPMASSSQCILSNDYSIRGSSEFYTRPQSYVAHIYTNGNLHGNYGNCNGYDYHYGSLPSDPAQQAHQVMPQGFGNGHGGLVANGNMVSASLPSNLGQSVQQEMPNTGLFHSNMMPTMDDPNPIMQQEFLPISGFNGTTGGIPLSPWAVDDDGDMLRSYLVENNVMMQDTTTTNMVQGTRGDGFAGQTSTPQPQDPSDFFNWESSTQNKAASTSGRTGAVTDEVMECPPDEDEIDKFFG